MISKLGFKILAVIVISFGLFVPLLMMVGLIHDRSQYRDRARMDVARSWTGAQTVVGPVLAIPAHPVPDEKATNVERQERLVYVLPETLDVQASLRTETRRRGIYSVPVYTARLVLTGEFDLAARLAQLQTPGFTLDMDGAFVAFSLTDNRGIVENPKLAWAGTEPEISSGTPLPSLEQGVHSVVGPIGQDRYPFRMELELRGMESLSFSPVAQDTRVMLDAGWPSPSFVGGFLPVEYQIDDDRFTAEWKVSGLATGWRKPWIGWDPAPPVSSAMSFGVSLFNSVDVYQQAMRSVKYGNLIVLLTFTAFFLIETVRRLMLHPLQYLLIGLALVIFFLLLLALSEHVVFWAAYVIAAASCVGLVTVYTAAVLRSLPNAAGVAAILGGLYGMLYAIMRSEDNALLMGSMLLFAALAAVMLVTRRIDWYRMGRELRPPGELPATD